MVHFLFFDKMDLWPADEGAWSYTVLYTIIGHNTLRYFKESKTPHLLHFGTCPWSDHKSAVVTEPMMCMKLMLFCNLGEYLQDDLQIHLATRCKSWSQINKETTRLIYKSDCFDKFTKIWISRLYKFPLHVQASNLYLQWYFVEIFILFLQVETLHVHSAIEKRYTCNFFIELTLRFKTCIDLC